LIELSILVIYDVFVKPQLIPMRIYYKRQTFAPLLSLLAIAFICGLVVGVMLAH
jgi:hypothetical protein